MMFRAQRKLCLRDCEVLESVGNRQRAVGKKYRVADYSLPTADFKNGMGKIANRPITYNLTLGLLF